MPNFILKAGVIGAAIYAVIALVILVARTFSFGGRAPYASSHGRAVSGILYAFMAGMMPWAKESVSKHLPTFVAGIIYHLGILAAFIYLTVLITSITLPLYPAIAIRLILLIGLICGLALLIKRGVTESMRAISTPDDFLANLLVDLFMLGALLMTFSYKFETSFYIMTVIMFLYIPMGKIRHCFFFFYTRILFGTFFGRRGVLPHPTRKD
jgi:nitrate reductase gamma subunit